MAKKKEDLKENENKFDQEMVLMDLVDQMKKMSEKLDVIDKRIATNLMKREMP